MAHGAAPRTNGTARLVGIGGAAALAGGLAWVIKGVTILVVGEQPPLAFGLALPLFGLGLLGVAVLTSRGIRRTIAVGLAWLAVVAGVMALWSELFDSGWDLAIVTSSLALLMGQLTLPRKRRRTRLVDLLDRRGHAAGPCGGRRSGGDRRATPRDPPRVRGTRVDAGGMGDVATPPWSSCTILSVGGPCPRRRVGRILVRV